MRRVRHAAPAVTILVLAALAFAGGAASSREREVPAYTFAISPRNSNVVYAGTASGIFKSTNGGRTWKRTLRSGGEFQSLAIDPTRPGSVYAGTGEGIYRLVGDRWRVVDGLTLNAWLLVHDPKRPAILWKENGYGLQKSLDDGRRWLPADRGLGMRPLEQDTAFLLNPRKPDTAYVVVTGDVYETTNGGKSWHPASKGLGSDAVEVLAIDPERPATLYAGTGFGIFKTTNGAATWRRLSDGHPHSLVVAPRNPNVLYALGYVGGVAKSVDGGRTWKDASTGLGPGGMGRARAGSYLFVDPRSSKVVYLLGEDAIYKTRNGGASWRRAGRPGV